MQFIFINETCSQENINKMHEITDKYHCLKMLNLLKYSLLLISYVLLTHMQHILYNMTPFFYI